MPVYYYSGLHPREGTIPVHTFFSSDGGKPVVAMKSSIIIDGRNLQKTDLKEVTYLLNAYEQFDINQMYTTDEDYDYALLVENLENDSIPDKLVDIVLQPYSDYMGIIIDHNPADQTYTVGCGPYVFTNVFSNFNCMNQSVEFPSVRIQICNGSTTYSNIYDSEANITCMMDCLSKNLSPASSCSTLHEGEHGSHLEGAVSTHSSHQGGAVSTHGPHQGGAVSTRSSHQGGAMSMHGSRQGGAIPMHGSHQGGAVSTRGSHQGGAMSTHGSHQGGAKSRKKNESSSFEITEWQPNHHLTRYIAECEPSAGGDDYKLRYKPRGKNEKRGSFKDRLKCSKESDPQKYSGKTDLPTNDLSQAAESDDSCTEMSAEDFEALMPTISTYEKRNKDLYEEYTVTI